MLSTLSQSTGLCFIIIIIFNIIIIIIINIIIITKFISAVLVREEAAALTSTVAGISPVRALLVVNLYQVSPQSPIHFPSVFSVSFVPWRCGGRYLPVLCCRVGVEVGTFQY